MSFEKFLVDEELVGMLKKLIRPTIISKEEIDVGMFREVGIGGEFMSRERTIMGCRSAFFDPVLMPVTDYERWERTGRQLAHERANHYLRRRLETYQEPDIDPALKRDLVTFVERQKK